MTTMIDEIFDRQYQAGRADLHDGIDSLVKRVGGAISNTFTRIHRIQFDSPWAKKNSHCT